MNEKKIPPRLNAAALENLNVIELSPLASPEALKATLPITVPAKANVLKGREALRATLSGSDSRLVVIVGPCSIHNPKAAIEYATRLSQLSRKIEGEILIVMRVYFEKPRTTIGWKGLINDPKLDGSQDINLGLTKARQILLAINELGLPCASEFLDPIVPQYTADLVSWVAIGARTSESQTHREMASGLSMPVGFKNSTDGDLQNAIDAMVSAEHPHSFLGIDQKGQSAIVRTRGNPDVHVVLRGGGGEPNYSPKHIAEARANLKTAKERRLIMVDCSHGNSNKDYRRQPLVFDAVLDQILGGETAILGVMLESHLNDGNQKLEAGLELRYGVSITDGCISWETTEALLLKASQALKKKRR